jgi:thioredoxin 1
MADLLRTLFGKKEEEAVLAPEAAGVAAVAVAASDAEPVHVTDETFEEQVLGAGLPVMVDFWAPWCGPCRMVAPIVEDLAQAYDGRALMVKINTDENPHTPSRYQIMGIPTLILFKDGQEVDRVVGFAPRKALEERLQQVIDGR